MPTVVNDGVRIHFEAEGDGPTIVLVTGAGGDRRLWADAGYVTGLRGFRTVRIDRRGRGESDRPTELEAHRMPRFVSDVAAVLDAVGAETAGFWGYSNGILIGIAFGATYPGRLGALIGTGSLPPYNLDELPPLDPEAWIAQDVAAGGVQVELEACMTEENDRFPDSIDRNVREGDPLMHALDRLAWRTWHGPKSGFADLRAPVLMITGEKEDLEHRTETAIPLLHQGRVLRMAGQGHLGAFYRSDLALPHALPFLRKHLG